MKCPNCQTENSSGATHCSACGASLAVNDQLGAGVKAVSGGSIALGKKNREARIREAVDPSAIISERAYNGVIVAVLLWGLLVNWLLCNYVGNYTRVFPNMSPIAFLIGYVVLAIIGVVMTNKAKSTAFVFIGYNLVVIPFGLVISTLVETYVTKGQTDAVTLAFLYTVLIAVAMLATVMVFPQLFEKIGKALAVAVGGLILCEIILLIFGVRQEWTSWIAATLFSLYLGYDIYRSQQYPKTVRNAMASALDIYMDLANIFIRLLEVLGKKDN
jgi:hypothetical protein